MQPDQLGQQERRGSGGAEAGLRILFVAEPAAGGVRRHVRWLTEELRRREIPVDLALSECRAECDFEEDLAVYRDLGCRVAMLPVGRLPEPVADLRAVSRLRRVLRDWKPDVVHCHATKAGIVGRLAALGRVPRSAVFYSPHAFFFQGCSSVVLRRLGACGEWALSRLCGRLVVVSQAEADVAVSTCHISRRRLAIVPNGLPDKRFTGLLPRRVARQQFGGGTGVWAAVVGRFSTQKGHDRLLRVLALLPEERRRDLTVFLFGEGEEEPALRRMADELGVSDCLRWPGYVPTVAADLRAFDILFLPSRYEGLSYALLEGLCSGVPVVAADIPANRLTGFGPPALRLASFDDPAGALPVVTEALVSAPMGDPERVASLAREAFSVRRQVDQLLGLYLSGVREAERRA